MLVEYDAAPDGGFNTSLVLLKRVSDGGVF